MRCHLHLQARWQCSMYRQWVIGSSFYGCIIDYNHDFASGHPSNASADTRTRNGISGIDVMSSQRRKFQERSMWVQKKVQPEPSEKKNLIEKDLCVSPFAG